MEHDELFGQRKDVWNVVYKFIAVALLLLNVINFLISTNKHNDFIKLKEHFSEKIVEEDVCHYGFKSVVSKMPSDSMVERRYSDALKIENYSMIDFDIEEYKIVSSTTKESGKCKLIIRKSNSEGHGLRAFIVSLVKNKDFEFNFKVNGISEIVLDDSDLKWR